MIAIEKHLAQFGVSKPKYTRFLQQVSVLCAQIDQSNIPCILNAIVLMVELHIDQKPRPDGTEYIEHPLSIAIKVLEAMAIFDCEILIATLLHDTVEDQTAKLLQKTTIPVKNSKNKQKLALDVIENYTSIRVRNIVSALTNPDFDQILKEEGIKRGDARYSLRTNQLYVEHLANVMQNTDAALIKIFDFDGNALNLNAIHDDNKRIKLKMKYVPGFQIIIQRLNDNTQPLNMTQKTKDALLYKFTAAYNDLKNNNDLII